jgi:hypothetical protein
MEGTVNGKGLIHQKRANNSKLLDYYQTIIGFD